MMLQSRSEIETKEIGRKIGKELKCGDVVCLYGELGSGKTTLVKGIASVIGIDERDITSPSFTIISEHKGKVPLYHIDLYRVSHDRIAELGLEEYIGRDGISVLEWAERADREIPDESIKVRLVYTGDNARKIEITGIRI